MMLKFKAYVKDLDKLVDVTEINFNLKAVKCALLHDKTLCVYEKYFDEVKLLQYIGLNDRNNNEIYEGDIVEFDISLAYEYDILNKAIVMISNIDGVMPVLFTVEECGDKVEWSDFEKHIDKLDFFNDCEIIGNIYETPYLL